MLSQYIQPDSITLKLPDDYVKEELDYLEVHTFLHLMHPEIQHLTANPGQFQAEELLGLMRIPTLRTLDISKGQTPPSLQHLCLFAIKKSEAPAAEASDIRFQSNPII